MPTCSDLSKHRTVYLTPAVPDTPHTLPRYTHHTPLQSPPQKNNKTPPVSFNHEGVFIGGSSSCNAGEERTSLAALYVMSKEALYSPPPSDPSASADIGAAIYLTRNSWYRSVTPHELSLTPDAFEPFNSIPAPSRPQGMDDMKRCPLFVMKVGGARGFGLGGGGVGWGQGEG